MRTLEAAAAADRHLRYTDFAVTAQDRLLREIIDVTRDATIHVRYWHVDSSFISFVLAS